MNVLDVVIDFEVVGFSGSRQVGASSVASAAFAAALVGAGFSGRVAVGCATGVDACIRTAFPHACVHRAASLDAWALAARSSALVRSLVGSGVLVAFPAGACPSGLMPSRSFSGVGSGTWGAVCLALGLGVPVLIFSEGSLLLAPRAVAARFVALGAAELDGVQGGWWLAAGASGVQGTLF